MGGRPYDWAQIARIVPGSSVVRSVMILDLKNMANLWGLTPQNKHGTNYIDFLVHSIAFVSLPMAPSAVTRCSSPQIARVWATA